MLKNARRIFPNSSAIRDLVIGYSELVNDFHYTNSE